MAQFEPREAEVTTSTGRVFKLRELTAYEQMAADGFGGDTLAGAVYARTAAAIVSIDGESVFGTIGSELGLTVLLKKLGGKEFDEIALAYATQFAPKPADAKNESAPAA
jgi:hypothetical protein